MNDGCSIGGFCDLLHEVSSACARAEAEALARGKLAVAEFHALSGIAAGPRPLLEDLAARLSVSRGRLTRIIDRLEAKGLVTRRRDEDDLRSVVLEMTTGGHKALSRAAKLRGEAGASLLAGTSAMQQARLVESLELLRDMMHDKAPGEARRRRARNRSRLPEGELEQPRGRRR